MEGCRDVKKKVDKTKYIEANSWCRVSGLKNVTTCAILLLFVQIMLNGYWFDLCTARIEVNPWLRVSGFIVWLMCLISVLETILSTYNYYYISGVDNF